MGQNSRRAFVVVILSSVVSDFLRPRGLQDARLPVPHHLLECAQTPVHWVNDAIQPSLPRPPPSPATLWGSTSIREQVPGPGCLRSAWPGRHSPPAATGLTMCPGPEASCFCLKLSLATDNGSPSLIGGDQGGPFLLALSRHQFTAQRINALSATVLVNDSVDSYQLHLMVHTTGLMCSGGSGLWYQCIGHPTSKNWPLY